MPGVPPHPGARSERDDPRYTRGDDGERDTQMDDEAQENGHVENGEGEYAGMGGMEQ